MKTIRLRNGQLGRHNPNHPWIYKRQFLKVEPSIKPGDIVSVISSEGSFLGRGYYNPRSEISIRMLTFRDEAIDKVFFDSRIKKALEKRKGLLSKTNAYRAIFSEADELPGLIMDMYSDTLVFQFLTLGMEKFKDIIVECARAVPKARYIYEKSVSAFRKLEGLKDVQGWHGDQGDTIVEISEGKARFLVDLLNGHKTGFYLDQRNSRLAMEPLSKEKKVLDLFCYTGAFSVSSASFGANEVTAIDIKDKWLELGRKNARLNNVEGRIEFIKGDAFFKLKDIYNSGEKFDIIIVDPPSFLKKRESIKSASKGYSQLNLLAMKALREGGILATFSCSGNMPNEAFSDTLKKAVREAGKRMTILKRCHQAEDHPIIRHIPQTDYLKGYFLKIENIEVDTKYHSQNIMT